MATDLERLTVARQAQRLADGYYAFLTAHLVAVNPQSVNSLPPARSPGEDPIGEVARKDGTFHVLNLRHHLDLLRTNQGLQGEFLRAWAMGALLAVGDELQKHGYFDHAPILELVYHLRNGVAHGNRFNIDHRGQARLAKHEAHNRDAPVTSPAGTVFEITSNLSGPVLFDYMGAADVIDLLQSVELYLSR